MEVLNVDETTEERCSHGEKTDCCHIVAIQIEGEKMQKPHTEFSVCLKMKLQVTKKAAPAIITASTLRNAVNANQDDRWISFMPITLFCATKPRFNPHFRVDSHPQALTHCYNFKGTTFVTILLGSSPP